MMRLVLGEHLDGSRHAAIRPSHHAARWRSDPIAHRYTGHERDSANLGGGAVDLPDYMHARFYSANVGRFLSTDQAMDLKGILPNPQRWNRYSYVSNNPINKIDPNGCDEWAMEQRLGGYKDDWERDKPQAEMLAATGLAALGGGAAPVLARAAFTTFPRLFLATMGIGAAMTGAPTGPSVNLGSGGKPIVGVINVDDR